MQIGSDILDHWSEVRSHLPADFDLEATARARGALTRVRAVRSADDLLRLALGYGACGMSLRETCAWAAAAGIADLSDPALIERLEKAADWLEDIVGALLAAPASVPSGRWAGYRLRLVDATALCAPGADRTSWRLHVGYNLASDQIDQIELTDERGAESLNRFEFEPGDIALGDRGYARPRDLRPVLAAGADLVVRIGWNSLRLMQPDGMPLDLFAVLAKLRGAEGETWVCVDEGNGAPDGPLLPLRLVIRRKAKAEAAKTQKRLLKEAKKRGKKPDPRSLVAANFILLLTSLPADAFPPADVLELYRMRWQIELAFKRMKSLAGLDALPAKKPNLARAWIYARLIAILIADRIAGQVPDSPPFARRKTPRQPLPLAPRQDGARHRSSRHSRAMSLEIALPCP
jgi:hypothetical protein